MKLSAHRGGAGARGPQLLVGLGGLFMALLVGEWVVVDLLRPEAALTGEYAFTFLVNGVPAVGVSYGGYWLTRSEVEPDQYRRVLWWCTGGLFAFLTLNLLMIQVWPAESFRANFGWARGTAILGAAGGLLIGVVEARTVARARTAERELAHTEHVETQRQWLGYLNSLLRHEVLNSANVIEGYSELLLDDDPDELTTDRLRVIQRQSRGLSEVISDVRVLLEATDEPDELVAVDVSAVVTEQLVELRARHSSVRVETAMPGSAYALADDLLPRVFSNLLNNAVEHHDGDEPTVSVGVETTPDTVVVTIADDGPGVPESKRETLFEGDIRSSNHGLGLYLVRTLTERYGGTVELRETGPDGSVFAVELPRTEAESDERAGDAGSVVPAAIAVRTG